MILLRPISRWRGPATSNEKVQRAFASTSTQESPVTVVPSPSPASSAAVESVGNVRRRGDPGGGPYAVAWGLRAGWLALLALATGLYGEYLVLHGEVTLSIRWYALAIVMLLVAWSGRLKKQPFLRAARPAPSMGSSAADVGQEARAVTGRRHPWGRLFVSGGWRYLLAGVALAGNVLFVGDLRAAHFDSALGGLGWLASILLLALAFTGHHSDAASRAEGIGAPPVSRRVEYAIIAGIFLLALGIRLFKLDDWTLGMHGDEGEAGTDALAILNGAPASPFQSGWFGQPNFYYFALAGGMRLFGTGLFGLRIVSVLAGSLLVLPVYGLVRRWFGLRAAIIAGTMLAISDVAITFSRMEFSNITTPLFLATALYFLFRGFGSGWTLDFVLSGYAAMLSMYFYMGGRIAPFMMAAVIAYLLIVLPLVGVPAAYRRLKSVRGVGALSGALREQFALPRRFAGQVLLLAAASYCFAAPFFYYYLDNRTDQDARTQDKLVFNNPRQMEAQYSLNHDPLYLGLKIPSANDLFPGLPLTFEETPLSIKLAGDGFWPRALWDQLTTSLSILTYHYDASSVYTFSLAPATKPIEAVLVVLGIAWAIWNWRDHRMGVLMIWFWSIIIVGGVLTINAPYMARLVGIIPVLAILAAVVLDKLAYEITRALRLAIPHSLAWKRAAAASTGLALGGVLVFLTWQNVYDYYVSYASAAYPFAENTGLAVFVRDASTANRNEGRAVPHFYNLGAPRVIWSYGVNRFLNYGTKGEDIVNPSDALPLTTEGDQDAVFIVWPGNAQYLPVLKSYYPGGREEPFVYTPTGKGDPLFYAFRVSAEEIALQRSTTASYAPPNGTGIARREPGFGTASAPPEGLTYPLRAAWSGGIVAPTFAHYAFHVDAQSGAVLSVDGAGILEVPEGSSGAQADFILSKGVHKLQLSTVLNRSTDSVDMQWSLGGSGFVPIPANYLWNGPYGALLAEIRPESLDPLGDPPPDANGGDGVLVVSRRSDGLIGFQSIVSSIQTGESIVAGWQGRLIAPASGHYGFRIRSDGPNLLIIDGQTVVNGSDATPADPNSTNGEGEIDLTEGLHNLILRYNWNAGPGILELYWTPPGGAETLVGPGDFDSPQGVWQPGMISEPPPYSLPGSAASDISLKLQGVIGGAGALQMPRGLASDEQGRIFVGDRGNHRVVVYSADGTFLRAWGNAPPGEREKAPGPGEFVDIQDLAVSPEGRVYVLDRGNPMLQVFDADGRYLKAYDTRVWRVYNPCGLFFAGGLLYVADTGQNRLLRVEDSPTGSTVTEMKGGAGNAALNQPLSVAVAPGSAAGDEPQVFAADVNNRVVELSANGASRQQWAVQIGGNDGGSRIAPLPDGRLLISDPDRGRLGLLDSSTDQIGYFGQAGSDQDQLGVITGMVALPDGRLYIINSDRDYIQVFKLETGK